MTKQYEFRLLDMSAADGEIDADRLVELVQTLKDLALRIGRVTTGAGEMGRPPRSVDRLARLSIGLGAGSTRLQFARSPDPEALAVEVPIDDVFDTRFHEVLEGVAKDVRPQWVDDFVAGAAAGLAASLHSSAPQVDLSIDGVWVRRFRPGDLRRHTWAPRDAGSRSEPVTITGVLDRVDLRSYRFRVRDDVGFDYALPLVADPAAAQLIGSRVVVTGWIDHERRGRVTQLHGASVEQLPDGFIGDGVSAPVPLAVILATGPGPQVGALDELSVEESEDFLVAMGL